MKPENGYIDLMQLQLGIPLTANQSFEQLRDEIAGWINDLLKKDFEQVVSILYRVDVNETKLKFLLHEKVGEESAYILADLIIERQLQKWESRKSFLQSDTDDDTDERW